MLYVNESNRLNTLKPRQNGGHFANAIFKCIVLNEIYEFWLQFPWSLLLRSNLQYSNIGSEKDLAPTRRQAIVWTNDGLFTDAYMRHSASMS